MFQYPVRVSQGYVSENAKRRDNRTRWCRADAAAIAGSPRDKSFVYDKNFAGVTHIYHNAASINRRGKGSANFSECTIRIAIVN